MTAAQTDPGGPKVGVLLPTFDGVRAGRTPPVLEGARLIEAAGFDGAWVGDHLACPAPLLDAVTCLGAAAAVTERIALGFSVLLLGLRPPAWTAKQLVTIDALAPGRLRLGVGVGGEFPYEFEAAGVPLAQRGRRVDETLEILPDLLAGRPVSHRGRVFELEVQGLEPAISAQPPVYIGGRGDAALARAGRHADVWMPMWLSPESIVKRLPALEAAAGAAGRPTPRLAALVLVNADPDPGTARREAERHIRGQYGMDLDRVAHWAGLGPAEAIAELLAGYVDVGVEEFVLMPLGSEPLTQIERLAEVRELVADHAGLVRG
jgi:alkanesulfonate monooxygenase SsuD/methylene tetrahydromethanopterin reductase-like flavin-dependent oxidoreductase (luciferase family)